MIVYVLHVYDRVLVVLWAEMRKLRDAESFAHTIFDTAALVDIPGYDLAVLGAC
jgi:hypothetical protein